MSTTTSITSDPRGYLILNNINNYSIHRQITVVSVWGNRTLSFVMLFYVPPMSNSSFLKNNNHDDII